tara:strand:+ start:1461 stop:1679 length:219 start_codon:yes stop_codon:yes gene_type:complete
MSEKSEFLFGIKNYILLLLGLLLLVVGFLLMIGGGGETVHEYNPEIFSIRRIFIAPAIVILGYLMMIVAIFS